MQEGAVMEIIKWFTGILMLFLLLSFTALAIDASAVNNYKQEVNYVIERNGGLTVDALDSLREYSEENYGGRFEVTNSPTEKVNFGEVVDYTIKAEIPVRIFPVVPNVEFEVKGSGVSYVR